MNRMLVIVFDNEKQAELGNRALHELDTAGSITLYALGVVAKDEQGVAHVRTSTGQQPVGTGVGLAVGSMVGLLAGPVGLAVGAVAGTLAGAMRDFWVAGVSLDFVEEAEQYLQAGKVALVAEVEEEWVLPLDSRMEALGGLVIRRNRADVAEARFDHDVADFRAEVASLTDEMAQATGNGRDRLKARLTRTQAQLDAALAQTRRRVDELQAEAASKVDTLKAQMEKAQGEAREALERRMDAVRSGYDTRSAKLGRAWDLTKAAFSV